MIYMLGSNDIQKGSLAKSRLILANTTMSPIMEEGLLIGIAIVAILIVVGIIFGVFEWIGKSFGSLFDQFGILYAPI